MDLTKAEPIDLADAPTAALHEALRDAIGVTARAIAQVARLWVELERRGENMDGYRWTLRQFMRPVAEGRVLPEVVAQLGGEPRKLSLVAELPVADQRRLVIDAEPVEIAGADGGTRRTSVAQMTYTEAARVIRDGAVRTPREQMMTLTKMQRRREKAPGRGRPYRIAVDIDGGVVRIGDREVDLLKLAAAMRAAGIDVKV
jgi:hypothetical protein